MKRQIPFLLVFLFALFHVIQYFVPHESFEWLYEFFLDWIYIIGIFALALGIYSLFRVSVDRIRSRRPNWAYNYLTLVGLFLMVSFGFVGQEPALLDSGTIDPGETYTRTLVNKDAVSDTIAYYGQPHRDMVGVIIMEGKDRPDLDTTLRASVNIADRAFLPDTLVIASGTAVTWTNLDRSPYSLLTVGDDSWGTYWLWLALFTLLLVVLIQVSATSDSGRKRLYALLALGLIVVEVLLPTLDSNWGFFFYTQEGLTNPMFRDFFDYVMMPILATMFALLAFFIASAAYRAFRARNLMATLLLVAALIVMLRFNPYLPFAEELGFYSKLSNWLMNVPNLAAQRAILIGIGLGIVSTSIKVMLGIERGYMGRG